MPSIQVGQSSSAATPILDLLVEVGDPPTSVDVAVLQFQVYSLATGTPVQTFPTSGWQSVDPTTAYDPVLHPTGVRLGPGHYFAPWSVPVTEPLGNHTIVWRWQFVLSGPFDTNTLSFYVAGSALVGPDPSLYCSIADIRAEGFTDLSLYPDSRIASLIPLWSRFVDKVTGRWFWPKPFAMANPPVLPQTAITSPTSGQTLPQSTIYVDSTGSFSETGTFTVASTTGLQTITYQGTNGASFIGCSGGTGVVADDAVVTSAITYPTPNLLPGLDYPTPTQSTLLPGDQPMMIDGQGRRDLITCQLQIPICRIDAIALENQAFLHSQLTWIPLSTTRVYNRHLRGMNSLPDDRDNPQVGFTVVGRIVETIASGLYPAPRIFPVSRLGVFLFGVFGYTDPDPTGVIPEGVTPLDIRRVTKLLVIRDLIPEFNRARKIPFQSMHRIVGDQEGSTNVRLQDAWLKGGVTGDPEIDRTLAIYKRPPVLGCA
jgi:hypothetical protein